jgi:RHS repeat-associated protein
MRIFLFVLTLCYGLLADESQNGHLAVTEGEPSSFVGEMVSAITGDCYVSQDDVVITGAEPIRLRRTYLSPHAKGPSSGWGFYRHTVLTFYRHAWRIAVAEPSGTELIYRTQPPGLHRKTKDRKRTWKKERRFLVDHKYLERGMTNCSQGEISARLNLKNNFIQSESHFEIFNVHSCNGTVRCYKRMPHQKEGALIVYYLLQWESLPNGNKIYYGYDHHHRLNAIRTTNPAGTKNYAWAHVHYLNGHKDAPDMDVETSDGKVIRYRCEMRNHHEQAYYLKRVASPDFPEEAIEYHGKNDLLGHLVSQRSFPDGRFVQVQYHTGGALAGRVASLRAPIGPSGGTQESYRLEYAPGEYGKRGGHTDVYDALGHLTRYTYSPHLRLEAIQRFDGGRLSHTENLAWGDSGQLSYLLGKTLRDANGHLLTSVRYRYDDRGNIVEQILCGNLSGALGPLCDEGQAEAFSKRCFFSTDGRNLLMREEEGGKITRYSYSTRADLLTAKFVCATDDRPAIRHFYEYNDDLVLVRESTDNGTSFSSEDLTGVTERRIRVTHPRTSEPFVGMPEVIEEWYWENGTEIFLGKTVLTYSREGRIARKDIYDAQDVHRYTLCTAYNALGQPTLETNALGQQTLSTYDANGNRTSHREYSGRVTFTMGYDSASRLLWMEENGDDGTRRLTQHEYDAAGNRTTSINHQGNRTTYTYDAFGRPLTSTEGSLTTTRTYDSLGNETSLTDPAGNTKTTQYNARGKPTHILHPDGTSEHFLYNLDGTLHEATDQAGTRTVYTYDFLGRETSKTLYAPSGALLSQERYEHNAFRLTAIHDASGNTTRFFYDGAGRKIAETFNDNERIEYRYDALGRVYTAIANQTLWTITERDLLGRIIEERKEDAHGVLLSQTRYTYDSAGNKSAVIQQVQGQEACEQFQYDPFGRPLLHTNALGHKTHTRYDDHFWHEGRYVLQKTTIDPLGLATIDTHDVFGRVIATSKKNAFGEELSLEEFQYDAAGLVTEQRSRVYAYDGSFRVSIIRKTYDTLNRLLSLTEGADSPEHKTTRYTYTPTGLLHEILKPDGVILTHTYDPLGRQTAITSSDGALHTTLHYNAQQHLAEVRDHIHSTVCTRDYDSRGRVTRETLANGLTLSSQYDILGRRTALLLPDASSVRYTYDPLYMRAASRYDAQGVCLYEHRYTAYDASGHLLTAELPYNLGALHSTIDPLGRTVALRAPSFSQTAASYDARGNILTLYTDAELSTYTYDPLSQLTSETGPFTHEYAYDSHYNRLQCDSTAYTINALNQIVSGDIAYDPNGNPIRRGATLYAYDPLDRLIEVLEPNRQRLTFIYDHWHRRLAKTVQRWAGDGWETAFTLLFLYDGQNEIGAHDATGTLVELRVLGSAPQAEIGAAIALELRGAVYIPLHNLQGSVAALLSPTGERVESYRYSAFGEENAPTPALSPWRFSSKRVDSETGLVYYGRRYYDPSLGRWLTPDPQGLSAGINLYAFLGNDPLLKVDLYGLEALAAQPSRFATYFQPVITTLGKIRDFIGKVIYNVFFHAVPIPGVRHLGKTIGKALQSNPEKRTTSPSQPLTWVGDEDADPGDCRLFINGMNTTYEEALQQARYISKQLGGKRVGLLYNSTHGTLVDLMESLFEKGGGLTHPVKLGLESLQGVLQELRDASPEGTLSLITWSEGGAIAAAITDRLSPQDKSMVRTYSLASPQLFTGQGLKSAQHYVSTYDIVPMTDPVRYLRAAFSSTSNVHFIKSKTAIPFFDHKFKSPTYKEALKMVCREILKPQENPL